MLKTIAFSNLARCENRAFYFFEGIMKASSNSKNYKAICTIIYLILNFYYLSLNLDKELRGIVKLMPDKIYIKIIVRQISQQLVILLNMDLCDGGYKMAQKLVIVESPAKAKTIKKFLGSDFKVEASMGHVRDLPKSQLGVDIENNFEPKYITIRGKGEIINKLKKEAKKSDKIFLATDPDREGEAISWHLAQILEIDENTPCRIEFNEITDQAVKNAVKKPRPINMNLVDAQQARRVLDRVVGYKISPLLWRKIRKGLSAGRVQSVATRIICEREKEIQEFVPEEYWNLTACFTKPGQEQPFEAKFYGKSGEKIEIKTEEQINSLIKELEKVNYEVASVKLGTKKRNPAPPFITSTLQQEASRKLGFTAQKTMMIAQQLYEGIEIEGEGAVGLITYIRTDSTRVSSGAQKEGFGFYFKTIWKRVCS